MKPHSLRRVLWLANVALGAAVIGVVAWFVLEVRPKVAEAVDRPPNFQPEALKAVRQEYEGMRVTGLKWTPEAPVSDEAIKNTVLRPDYAKRKHWIFSGPMPPPEVEDTGPVETGPPPPEGLAAIGEVSFVFLNPPDRSTMLFKFAGAKSLAFSIGDFVRASATDAQRFRLTDIVEVRPRVYEIKYDVYGRDPEKPESSGSLTWDESVADDEYPSFLRPADLDARVPAPAAPGAVPGTTPAGTAPAGTTDGASEGDTPEDDGSDEPAERVIDVGNAPAEDLTLKDLRPKIHVDDKDPYRRAVEFDGNSYRYFRGKNAKSIAETVKTSVAKDPSTGRVIGLRITGFQQDAPADVFDVRRGDILVSINGQKVNSRSDAINIVQKLSPENLVTVVIDRNGKLITYRVDPRDPRNKRKVRYFENLR